MLISLLIAFDIVEFYFPILIVVFTVILLILKRRQKNEK
jgi:hypothetical protein